MIRKYSATAVLILFLAACATTNDPNQKAKRGAATGAAVGAVAGAVIGNQSGSNRTGAVVGAVVGGAVGAAIGHRMDLQQKELQQIEGVEVTRPANDELNVVVKNDILFDYDSAALRAASRDTISKMGDVFSRYADTTIAVEGHADSVGSDAYNQTLSERRADAVRGYLIDQGVRSSRIVSRGYGESRPVATNDTPEGRQLNRRVEIHVKAVPETAAE